MSSSVIYNNHFRKTGFKDHVLECYAKMTSMEVDGKKPRKNKQFQNS